jgi:hypothetical protein
MHILSTQCDERKYHSYTHATLQLMLIKSSDLMSEASHLKTVGISNLCHSTFLLYQLLD